MDKNCRLRIKVEGGNDIEFNSEEELNSYIRLNKKGLVSVLLAKRGTIFSKDMNLPQQTESLLKEKNKDMHLRVEDHVYFKDLGGGVTQEGYTSTTKFITQKHNLGNPDKLEELVPEFSLNDYFANVRSELIDANFDSAYIEKHIEELTKKFELSSISGTSFHNIAENFILKKYKDGNEIKTDYPDLTINQANNYYKALTKLIENIKKLHGEDVILLPEFIIVDEQKNLTGTIDLLVIDNKGTIHIYDYKTSFKPVGDWTQVKKNAVDYQLTTYAQILRRQGFSVGKTKFIPVVINEYNETTNMVENFSVETAIDSTQSSRGDIQFKISYLLPHKALPRVDFIENNKNVDDFMAKSFNVSVINSTSNPKTIKATAAEQLKYMLESGKRLPDYKGREFIFLPSIGGKGSSRKLYVNDSEENQLKLISAYLAQMQSYNDNLPNKVIDYIYQARTALAENKRLDDRIAWGTEDRLTAKKLEILFTKYINSDEWEPLISDDMFDLGIVGFVNEYTKEVDFITITGKTLRAGGHNAHPNLIKGKKLLGNYLIDQKSIDLGFDKNITNGDVELLKVMAFIQNNEATFKDKKIGLIAAMQLRSNQEVVETVTQTLNHLQSQWDTLMKYSDDTELKRKAWKINQSDNFESLISFVGEMLNDKDPKIIISKNRMKVTNALKSLHELTDLKSKLKVLADIQIDLQSDVGSKEGLAQASYNKKRLIWLVANAYAQLSGVTISVEGNLKKFGDIIGSENSYLSIAERIKNRLVHVSENAMNRALNNAKHLFNENTKGLRDVHAAFYKGVNATDVEIKFVGNNYKFFENLIQKDGDRLTWRFKEESDPTLNPAEITYIKKYLGHINAFKRAKLVELNGEDSPLVESFDMSPPREIPLMKAFGYSALYNKGVKAYALDFWDSLTNETRILGDDDALNTRLTEQTAMYNQFDWFDTDPKAREEYLLQNGDADIEMDLEKVIYMYTMADAKQKIFNDEALPVLNNMKAIAMLSEYFHFEEIDNVTEYLRNRVGTVLFGKENLEGENATVTQVSKAGARIASTITLGLSVPTAMTEFWNNMFMSMSKMTAMSIGRKLFSAKSWAAAEKLVWLESSKTQMTIGQEKIMRHINAMYNLVEMDLGNLQHDKQSTSTAYGRNFNNKVVSGLNQIPNYNHRMAFFVAKMIEDGVIDTNGAVISKDSAIKMVGEDMVYDPKMDKRFKIYLANTENAPIGKEGEWKEARALYLKLEESLKTEPGGINQVTGLIARPYDNTIRDSLKSTADEVFGGYDVTTKNLFSQTAMGQVFTMFKRWMWSKKHRIWSDTKPEGRQGSYVYDQEIDASVWRYDIMEGVAQSMMALIRNAKESRDLLASWKELSPERKERIAWAFSDLILFALLIGLATFLVGEFTKDDSPFLNMAAKAMKNATSDLAFWTAASTVITDNNPIALYGTVNKVITGTIGLATGDSQATGKMLNTLGIYRSITPIAGAMSDE